MPGGHREAAAVEEDACEAPFRSARLSSIVQGRGGCVCSPLSLSSQFRHSQHGGPSTTGSRRATLKMAAPCAQTPPRPVLP